MMLPFRGVYSVKSIFYKQVVPYHENLKQTPILTIILPRRIF